MPAMGYSSVADVYDIYAQTDLDVPFFSRETFEALVRSQGFRVISLYGDYERSEFRPSPFVTWILDETHP